MVSCCCVLLRTWFYPDSPFSFFCLKLYIITITARTALMQRLSTRSAKRQKVPRTVYIDRSLSYYIVLIYYAVEAEIFNTVYFAYMYFSKPVEANIFNTLHSAD